MRSLVVVAALAAQFVFAAEAPFAFTLAWEQGEHSRDMAGSRSTYTLEGDVLTREQKQWGRMANLPGEERDATTTVKLTADQLAELKALVAATEKLTDVRIPTKQDVGQVLEASLTTPRAKGKPRVLVLEAFLTNEHARGAKAEILDPDPSDVKASARPAAKTWAAMHALYSKLLMLFPLR
jgi:uncharacterized protein YfaQ (DUF2300 family)